MENEWEIKIISSPLGKEITLHHIYCYRYISFINKSWIFIDSNKTLDHTGRMRRKIENCPDCDKEIPTTILFQVDILNK